MFFSDFIDGKRVNLGIYTFKWIEEYKFYEYG